MFFLFKIVEFTANHTSNSGLIQRWIRHSRNEHLWISTLAATSQGSPFWQTWGAPMSHASRLEGIWAPSITNDVFLQIQWLNPKTYIVYEDPNLVESCWIHWLFWIHYLRHSPAKNLWNSQIQSSPPHPPSISGSSALFSTRYRSNHPRRPSTPLKVPGSKYWPKAINKKFQ